MPLPPHLQSAFAAIDGYINAACEIIREGHMPDMQGMDRRVSQLCDTIESAEDDIKQQCLPQLNALLKKLDGCEDALQTHRAAQGTEHA